MAHGTHGDDASPFRRRHEPSAAGTLVLIAVVIAAAYGGFRTWSWWQASQHTPATAGPPSSQSVRTAPRPPLENRLVITAPAVQSAPSRGAVVKCVAKGVTTYATSVADCPARAEVTSVAIDPQLNVTEGIRDAPSILRAQSAVTQAPAIPSGTATDPNWDRKALCAAYEEEIKAIDAHARQPLSAWEQDYLAAKRKKARDQQFRLGC